MAKIEIKPSNLSVYLEPNVSIFYENMETESFQNFQNLFLKTMEELFPDLEFFINRKISGLNPKWKILESNSELEFFHKLLPFLPESKSKIPEWDEVCFFYFQGFSPLLDRNLTTRIWERHKKYLSQYSYSENLPPGIVPRILTREFLVSLPQNLNLDSHDFFLKNINNYDVEIFFHPPDLRQYRFSFYPNDGRSRLFLNSILDKMSKEAVFSYESILDLIQSDSEIFRSSPSYIELEIYRGCDLKCSFCPRQSLDNSEDGSFLEPEIIQKLALDLDQFGSAYTVCLGGLGEPFKHSKLIEILKIFVQSKHLTEVIIESALY
jgi:spiro-SPASM protein